MAGKFLDDDGLSHLITNIKNYVNNESTSLNNKLNYKVDATVNPLWRTGFYSLFLKALERDENTDTTTDPEDPGGNRAIKKALAKSGVITSVSESESNDTDEEGNLVYPNNAIALGLTSFKPVILNKNNVNPLREEYYPPFDVKYLTDTDLAADNKLTLDYARKSGLYFYKESKDINTDGKTLSFSDPYLSFVSRGNLYDSNTTSNYNKVKQVLIGPTIKFRESVLSTGLPFNPTGNAWTEWTEFTWEDLINTAANHLPLPGIGTPTSSDYILTYNASLKTTKINYSVLHSWDTWDSVDEEIPTTAAINRKLADYALKSDIGGGGDIDTSNLVPKAVQHPHSSTGETLIENTGEYISLTADEYQASEYAGIKIYPHSLSLWGFNKNYELCIDEEGLSWNGKFIPTSDQVVNHESKLGDYIGFIGNESGEVNLFHMNPANTYDFKINDEGMHFEAWSGNQQETSLNINESGVEINKLNIRSRIDIVNDETIYGSLDWGNIGDEWGLYIKEQFALVNSNDDFPYMSTQRWKLLFGSLFDSQDHPAPIKFNLNYDDPSISIKNITLQDDDGSLMVNGEHVITDTTFHEQTADFAKIIDLTNATIINTGGAE